MYYPSYAINVVKGVTKFLNCGQTPVIWMHQYTAVKCIYSNLPQLYGESLNVILFAQLYVLLDNYWTLEGGVRIVEIAKAGSAEATLKVTSVKKTKTIEQKQLCVVYIASDIFIMQHSGGNSPHT